MAKLAKPVYGKTKNCENKYTNGNQRISGLCLDLGEVVGHGRARVHGHKLVCQAGDRLLLSRGRVQA